MEIQKITCICCPMGCQIEVALGNGGIQSISDYTCNRGLNFAANEINHPERTVTTTVKVIHGTLPQVSVKTRKGIPKSEVFHCMEELRSVQVNAPVRIGDIIRKNICGTGIDVVATKDVLRNDSQDCEKGSIA